MGNLTMLNGGPPPGCADANSVGCTGHAFLRRQDSLALAFVAHCGPNAQRRRRRWAPVARDEQFHHMLKRIDRIPNGPVLNFAKVVHRVISVGDAAPRPSAITVASSQ